jgi:hypothetical protein
VGLAHGDAVFLEPDPESAILMSGGAPSEQTEPAPVEARS